MPSSRLSSCQPLAGLASRPLSREGLESSLLGMHDLDIRRWTLDVGRIINSAFYAIKSLWNASVLKPVKAVGETGRLYTRVVSGAWGWVKTSGFDTGFTSPSTQLFPQANMWFVSVFADLSQLYTGPTKETTKYKK